MRRVCFLLLVLSVSLSLPSYGAVTFEKTYGGSGSDRGNSVQQTSDGGYIIAGLTNSKGEGGDDVYLVKTDAQGTVVWEKPYGGSFHDRGRCVRQTSDGCYVIAGLTWSFGQGSGDVYLIKTDGSGNTLWTRTYGGTGEDKGYSVQQTADGGYIIGGSTISFGHGGSDAYLIKTDPLGNAVWTRTYGGGRWDYGNSVQQTSDGGYVLLGGTESFGHGRWGSNDVYLIKTDHSGNPLWTRTYGGTGTDVGWSVCETSDGGYIIGGNTNSFGSGLQDVYLIKTDPLGNVLWAKTYGGSSDDLGRSVQQTSDGGYVIVGLTTSFGAGSQDAYFVKTNSIGDVLWERTYGGSSSDWSNSIQETPDGGYITVGWTASFGEGGYDVYLVKTNRNGLLEERLQEVHVDIKPRSCPNPLNVKSKGLLPVAILGAQGFDVTDIDVSTIELVGVRPIRDGVEDVCRPVVDRQNPCDCTNEGADGHDDLTLKFKTKDIVKALGKVEDADVIELTLTGALNDGTEIEGSDCVVIIKKGKGGQQTAGVEPVIPKVFALSQNNPNPFSRETAISFSLPAAAQAKLRVYDVGGRVVATLVDREISAGVHTITWRRNNAGSGIYFYRLNSNGQSLTRRMVVLR